MWARLELGEELQMEYLTIAYKRYLLENYLDYCISFGNPIIHGHTDYSGKIEEAEKLRMGRKHEVIYNFFLFFPIAVK